MKILILILVLFSQLSLAQTTSDPQPTTVADVQKMVNDSLASKWYERIQLKGYADFRYNRLLETNKKLSCPLCDGSIGDTQGFSMRRARLTFYGDMNDRVFIYIQPDYATSGMQTFNGQNSPQQNYFQIRDAYFDYHLTENKEWRVRTGMSKVPFGFDNLQSSGLRPAMDRSDAINAGVPNERDTGVFVMYAPSEIRQRFKDLANAQLKGSGDYGVLSFGAYNGQSANRPERNNNLHKVARLTYPWKLKNGQYVETSIQAYEGYYNVIDQTRTGAVTAGGVITPLYNRDYLDSRRAVSLIVYPQPIGFQAEYNVGRGPQFDRSTGTIRTRNLRGGYAQVSYNLNLKTDRYQPYVRYQEYEGGKKLMTNEQFTKMHEWELGTEWQPNPAFELTVAYALSDRLQQSTVSDRTHLKGNLLRLQAQFNY